MTAPRALPSLLLLALASLGGSTGCATITRPASASLNLKRAPPDLVVLDETNAAVKLREEGAVKVASIPWKTSTLTLQTAGQATKVELDKTFSLGFFLVDYLLAVVPVVVDWATGKWTNYEDLDVPVALAEARKKPGTAVAMNAAASTAAAEQRRRDEEARQRAESEQRARASQTLVAERSPANPPAQAAAPALPPAPAAAAARTRVPLVGSGKLAVLDFKSYTDALKPEDVRYFTDVVRGATLRNVPGLSVMTRENLLVLLQATGKDAAQCEGECEVDTGRRIGADAVVSGEILKVGSRFKLSLKLHETRDGRLLSTSVGSGKNIDELDESAQAAAADLVAPVK